MRIILVLACLLLAGCTQGVDELPPPEQLAAPTAGEPTYEFIIFGRSVESRDQEVTIRLFVDGSISRFIDWSPEARSSEYEPIKRFTLAANTVSWDVVLDGNMVNGGQIDLTECPNGRADTFIRVSDHWQARSDYGCHVPGYRPSE